MARIAVLVVLCAGVAAAASVVLAHGSRAAGTAPAAVTAIQRTFVSTSGSDANPCTPTEPCRSFAVAIANTLPGGEVVALDSGGYGPFTVDKAITIAGAPGAHVAISVFSGSGITVDAGASDTVVLRNLYLTGLGGTAGILFGAGGSLHVESVVAAGFSQRGLFATAAGASLFVRDSVFRHNGAGVLVSGSLRAEIADSRADRNLVGFVLIGARGSIVRSVATRHGNDAGFVFEAGAVFTLSDSVADGNSTGVSVLSDAQVTLSAVTIGNNINQGLLVGLDSPVARIGGSTVTGNGIGLVRTAGALETFGDNLVRGNGTDTSGTITAVGKT